MRLYLLSNGQFLWKTSHYELPCSSVKEVFQIGTGVFNIPFFCIESGLIQAEELGDQCIIFDELGNVLKTERLHS